PRTRAPAHRRLQRPQRGDEPPVRARLDVRVPGAAGGGAGGRALHHPHAVAPMAERFDFLVIGSGVAGLSFALRAAQHGTVDVVTKKASDESNKDYAQGGIAAVMDPADSVEDHVRDTLVAGAGLCDEAVVRIVVTEGPERVRELMALGAAFDRAEGGALHLGREGGHSAHRIVHAADMTGREVERALLSAVRDHDRIRLYEYHFAVDLITEHHLGQDVTALGS